jgi:hypothetical protein
MVAEETPGGLDKSTPRSGVRVELDAARSDMVSTSG